MVKYYFIRHGEVTMSDADKKIHQTGALIFLHYQMKGLIKLSLHQKMKFIYTTKIESL